MSQPFPGFLAALLVAASGLAQATPKSTSAPADGPLPEPAQLCTASSVKKQYTRADRDFELVRRQLNASLAEQWPRPAGKHGGHPAGIPAAAASFHLRMEHSLCERLPATDVPLAMAGREGSRAKDCAEAGCADPLPGLAAPDGSVMIIWSCVNSVVREVEYERVNGQWKVKSSRQELVVSCPLPKDPGGGEDPDPKPDKG